MSKTALPAPLDSPSYWRRLLATCHPDKPDGDHDLFIFLGGLREHVEGCTSLSDRGHQARADRLGRFRRGCRGVQQMGAGVAPVQRFEPLEAPGALPRVSTGELRTELVGDQLSSLLGYVRSDGERLNSEDRLRLAQATALLVDAERVE
jgi:hypothetical protein